MKMELPRFTERFGSVKIYNVQRVLLLDSNHRGGEEQVGICDIRREDMLKIFRRMAIVVPVKDEKLKVMEGVISAIPEECLVIVVSNSKRESVNRYKMEHDIVDQHAYYTKRNIWIIHQREEGLGGALRRAGYTDLLDEAGLVNDGKAEGMVVGMLLAKGAGKDFVGFVDADNYVPGAVHEYVSIYAASFFMAKSPLSMVRVLWSSKPKILEKSLYFSKWGRVSQTTNKYLNRLISSFSGFETEVIKTGNSGDHAMSMKLAESLEFKPKFAIETEELVSALEQFGGVIEPRSKERLDMGVEVFQVETRNPHFHDEKGEDHVQDMLEQSLGVIEQSPLCSEGLKNEIQLQLGRAKRSRKRETRRIKPFSDVDAKALLKSLLDVKALRAYGEAS